MPAPTKIVKGITTIIWGTGNSVGTPNSAIVESIKITPKNGSPI